MDKWEYKMTPALVEAEMNAIGEEGWELAGVIPDTGGGGGYGPPVPAVILVFKRRKLQPEGGR